MCEKIQDFGQKIGGARKDMYLVAKEYAEKFTTAASVETLTCAKSLGALVKLPNLESLTNANAISADAARAVLAIWRSIDRRPSASPYRVNRWAQTTAPKLANIAALLSGAPVDDETRTLPEFRVLEAAEWPAVAFSFGKYTVKYYSASFCMSREYKERYLRIVSGGYYKGTSSTKTADIVTQLRALTAADTASRAEGPALAASRNRADRWFVHPEGKKEICIKLLPEGIDRAEVRRVLTEERAVLLESYRLIKKVPKLRRDWNRPRVGQDWRKGIDVTAETYAAVLPFRGVEFGNWVNQTERAALLNSAFDGFHDLAQLLNIAPAAVTLRGSLAFAFASRGIPGAAAHYECGHKVINLTKKNGAGCMAHEWFHAVDHFAAGGGANSFASEGRGGGAIAFYGNALYEAIKNTDFYKRSENHAFCTGSPYWTKPRELAARGFEGVVAFLLKRAGMCSDFLVNCLSMDEFTAADSLHRSDIYPYPTEQEAASLAPYYFQLLQFVFGVESCRIDSETAAEIENHRQTAEREREEAEARRKAKEQAEREARAAVAAQEAERNREQVEAKAKEVVAEIGADWYHIFESGQKFYAVGMSEEFAFVVYASTRTAFRIITDNKRMKKAYRPAHVCYFQVKPEADIRAEIEKQGRYVFAPCNAELYDLFRLSSTSTFADFCKTYAKEIEKEREERKKVVQERAKEEKVANIKADQKKAEKRTQSAENDAPHEALRLETMKNGVFVSGSTRATYYNRRQIKAHGATWNKEAQRWEATEPEAVARLRAWFGLNDQTTAETEPTAVENETPAADLAALEQIRNRMEAPQSLVNVSYSTCAESQNTDEPTATAKPSPLSLDEIQDHKAVG